MNPRQTPSSELIDGIELGRALTVPPDYRGQPIRFWKAYISEQNRFFEKAWGAGFDGPFCCWAVFHDSSVCLPSVCSFVRSVFRCLLSSIRIFRSVWWIKKGCSTRTDDAPPRCGFIMLRLALRISVGPRRKEKHIQHFKVSDQTDITFVSVSYTHLTLPTKA